MHAVIFLSLYTFFAIERFAKCNTQFNLCCVYHSKADFFCCCCEFISHYLTNGVPSWNYNGDIIIVSACRSCGWMYEIWWLVFQCFKESCEVGRNELKLCCADSTVMFQTPCCPVEKYTNWKCIVYEGIGGAVNPHSWICVFCGGPPPPPSHCGSCKDKECNFQI